MTNDINRELHDLIVCFVSNMISERIPVRLRELTFQELFKEKYKPFLFDIAIKLELKEDSYTLNRLAKSISESFKGIPIPLNSIWYCENVTGSDNGCTKTGSSFQVQIDQAMQRLDLSGLPKTTDKEATQGKAGDDEPKAKKTGRNAQIEVNDELNRIALEVGRGAGKVIREIVRLSKEDGAYRSGWDVSEFDNDARNDIDLKGKASFQGTEIEINYSAMKVRLGRI